MIDYKSVSKRIFIKIFGALFAMILMLTAWMIYINERHALQHISAAKKELTAKADDIATHINVWAEKTLAFSRTISDIPAVRQLDVTAMRPILKVVKEYSTIFHAVRVDNILGMAIARSDDKILKSYANREYFKQVISGEPLGQQIVIGKTNNKPLLCFSVPVYHMDAETYNKESINGVLNQCGNLTQLSEKITELAIGQTGYAFLIDHTQRLIATGGNTEIQTQLYNMSDHPAIVGHNDKKGIYEYTHDGIRYYAYQVKVGFNWQLIVQQPMQEVMAPIKNNQQQIKKLIGLSIAIALFIAWVVSRWIAEPVKKAHFKLERLSMYDPLTNLPNRNLFNDRIETTIEKTKRSGKTFAYLAVDFKDFKKINDTYGHQAGDAALKTISNRIKNLLRTADTIARIGGDEFITILCDIQKDNIAILLDRIMSVCDEPVMFDAIAIDVNINIGVSFFPDSIIADHPYGSDAEALFHYADVALYAAKTQGKSYLTYDSSMEK